MKMLNEPNTNWILNLTTPLVFICMTFRIMSFSVWVEKTKPKRNGNT